MDGGCQGYEEALRTEGTTRGIRKYLIGNAWCCFVEFSAPHVTWKVLG